MAFKSWLSNPKTIIGFAVVLLLVGGNIGKVAVVLVKKCVSERCCRCLSFWVVEGILAWFVLVTLMLSLFICAAAEEDWSEAMYVIIGMSILQGIAPFVQILCSALYLCIFGIDTHLKIGMTNTRALALKALGIDTEKSTDTDADVTCEYTPVDEPWNVYMAVHRIPIIHVVIVFAGQTALCALYLRHMLEVPEIQNWDSLFWYLGLIILLAQIGTGNWSQFYSELPFWQKLILLKSQYPVEGAAINTFGKFTRMEIIVRFCMSWLANGVFSTMVLLTIPLFTIQAESDIDFVKDCVAILFILNFDELAGKAAVKLAPDSEQSSGHTAMTSEQSPGSVQAEPTSERSPGAPTIGNVQTEAISDRPSGPECQDDTIV